MRGLLVVVLGLQFANTTYFEHSVLYFLQCILVDSVIKCIIIDSQLYCFNSELSTFCRVPTMCDFEPLNHHVQTLHHLVQAAQSVDEMSQTITDLLSEQRVSFI